jgi:hypothetical protein
VWAHGAAATTAAAVRIGGTAACSSIYTWYGFLGTLSLIYQVYGGRCIGGMLVAAWRRKVDREGGSSGVDSTVRYQVCECVCRHPQISWQRRCPDAERDREREMGLLRGGGVSNRQFSSQTEAKLEATHKQKHHANRNDSNIEGFQYEHEHLSRRHRKKCTC